MKCPRCQRENPATVKFCGECGARLDVACSACRAPNPPANKFCHECGAPIGPRPATGPLASPESYTPKHLAEKILTSKAALEGERKQVTVLFADLKGSMELLADRDPEEARRLLDPVLEHMMEAVHRYEGTVNQVMGDGIMALFGAPLAHEDHAVRACYAALRMQERVRKYADDVRHAHGVNVQIRVGLNSGEVVVRAIGSDLHMDYTAVGQTTHLAARMEQLAAPGGIHLTAETLRLAEGFVQVTPLGPVPVKGLGEPVEVFELVGAGAARTRLETAARRGLTRFVGRNAELGELQGALDRASQGHGQVIAVVGEPGVGKSRLFWELIHSHRVHGWLVLQSASVSYGKATAYLPVIELLRGYFAIESRDDPRKIQEKVTGKVLTLAPALGAAVPALLALLDVPIDEASWQGLDPLQRRRQTLDAVKRLLLRESEVQPLVVVFEDLHWIDSETQTLLDNLVEGLPAARLLLLVNYRPEYQHTWGGKTYYRQLRIDPLPPESADELLEALLGPDTALGPLKRLLVERTEANPLFLEESVRALVEIAALAGERGAYRLTRRIEQLAIPASVQSILAARIDRLAPEDKHLLQAAAAIGKDVPMPLLLAIGDLDEDGLQQGLARLQATEFLYEARLFPELEYTFKHALTQEVAYGSLLGERRRQLHAAIVDALERLHTDRVGEHVELLAHHATRGELRDKAVRYLRRAGAKAVARSANREAVALFEQALTLLEALPPTPETLTELLDTRIALGPALIALKGQASPEVETLYLRAREIVDRCDDTSRRFPVLWGLWFVNYSRGRYAAAHDAGERLLEAARTGEDTGRLLEAHHSLWATLTAMGRSTAAVVHQERGIALYDREQHASQAFVYGGHDPGACCRFQLSVNRWLLGQPDRALSTLEDALHLTEELKHPLTTAFTLWWASWVRYQRGEREAAAVTSERLFALASEYGFANHSATAAVLLSALGAVPLNPSALEALRRRLVAAGGAKWLQVFCLCVLAERYAEAGDAEEGLRVLASITEEDRVAFYAPGLHRLEGELLLRRSAPAADEAERCFVRAIELARGREEKSLELRAAMSLARLFSSCGRRADARALLAPVYGWFTEGFDTADLRAAKTLLNELSAALP